MQIIFNIGVTGIWHRTPFEFYADRDYPGTTFGFHKFDPNLRPVSQLPQKQKFHDEWTIPAIKNHQPGKIITRWLHGGIQVYLNDMLPHRLMILLLPLGIPGLFALRMIVWLALPLFIILISFYTFNLSHYALITVAAIFLMTLAVCANLKSSGQCKKDHRNICDAGDRDSLPHFNAGIQSASSQR